MPKRKYDGLVILSLGYLLDKPAPSVLLEDR